jgi:hypothetical protein
MKAPFEVFRTLSERALKLRHIDFPTVGTEFADQIDAIVLNVGLLEDRLFFDLAIVTSAVAHAFDKDATGKFIYQPEFRKRRYLRETLTNRVGILQDRLAMLKSLGVDRPLTTVERETFLDMHQNCRTATGHLLPLLAGVEMEAFLDAQIVREIGMSVRQTGVHGLSSYDGTRTYVAQDSDAITVPHELEHNIRCFIVSSGEPPSHIAPGRDPTLLINGVQCDAGFVSEHHYNLSNPDLLPKIPQELISPFSARWSRSAIR